ncbi:hypothetical protein [Sinorhizobium fredii]|uniref:hypothetical protein n=2 Tax=Rhizobium fredii TaxID=380 RepID=UPI001FCFA726|nr:hypothetical protein [Sinorhizobium fredii]
MVIGMALDERALSAALADVRRAYRLIWDFQRRCLDTMKFVAQQFPEREFYQWASNGSNQPPPNRSDPTRTWAWDFLPLYNCSFLYTGPGQDRWHPKIGDWLLEVRLLADTEWDVRDERIEPDPAEFGPVGESDTTLSIFVWKCTSEVPDNLNWLRHIWGQASWPADVEDGDEEGVVYMREGYLEACQLDISLAELTTKDAIKAFCGRAKRAFSQKLGIDFDEGVTPLL